MDFESVGNCANKWLELKRSNLDLVKVIGERWQELNFPANLKFDSIDSDRGVITLLCSDHCELSDLQFDSSRLLSAINNLYSLNLRRIRFSINIKAQLD